MSRTLCRSFLMVASYVWMTGGLSAQSGVSNGEWPSYAGDLRNFRYSPLDQINACNFNKLEVAWRFKTDNLGTRPEYKLEGTPLMVNGVVYATAGSRRAAIALDAATGELLWVHGEHEGARAAASPRQLSGRGLSYWTDGKGDERILYVTPGYRLICLDAKTGAPISLRKRRRGGHEAVRSLRNRAAHRSDNGRNRAPCNPGRDQERRGPGRLRVPRRRNAQDAQQHQRHGPRLRRAHRQKSCGSSIPFRGRANSGTTPG